MECGNQFAMHEEEFPPPLTHPPTDRPACCEHGQLKLPVQNDRDWAGRFWKGIPLLFLLCLGYNSSPLPSFFVIESGCFWSSSSIPKSPTNHPTDDLSSPPQRATRGEQTTHLRQKKKKRSMEEEEEEDVV